jgi:4-oxalocrotonate tautomerase
LTETRTMPTLVVRHHGASAQADWAALAQALTDITVRTLAKRGEVTAVLIDAAPAPHWFIGGQLPLQPTAWLEISVTTGTNTAAQKQTFMAEAHAALVTHVGGGAGLAEASYVIVRELPASDWGYDGLTQADRHAARQVTPPVTSALQPQSQAG